MNEARGSLWLGVALACSLALGCGEASKEGEERPAPHGEVSPSNPGAVDEEARVHGTVLVPPPVRNAENPPESRLFVCLKDYSSPQAKQQPWTAEIVQVHDYPLDSPEKTIPYEFTGVTPGTYAVYVLLDVGRPHVRPGSKAVTAYPGDYFSESTEVTAKSGESIEVSIESGSRVSIPDGYEAPVYADE